MPSFPAVSLCMGQSNGANSVSLSIWLGKPRNCGEMMADLETNQFQPDTLKPDTSDLLKLFDLTLR